VSLAAPLGFVSQADALLERPYLVDEAVDVVVARDAMTREVEEGRDRVAEDPVARRRDGERAGGVRAHEHDVDALARRGHRTQGG